MGRSFPPLPCPSCETGTMRLARGRVSTLARRNVTVHLRDFEAPRCDNSRCDEVFTQEVDEKAIHAAANAVLAEETRAHDTPGQAIADLAERRAPAPKPDELTVDDVLGVLAEVCNGGWEARTPKGYAMIARWGLDGEGAYVLDHEDHDDFHGTMAECLTEAKRRGLLG